MANAIVCVICGKDGSEMEFQTLHKKGAASVNRAILARQDDLKEVSSGQVVHARCRKDYCSQKSIEQKQIQLDSDSPRQLPVSNRTRSENSCVDMRKCCFLCCQGIVYQGFSKIKKGYEVSYVQTEVFDKSIRELCKNRNDEWALDVLGRISCVADLHAADAFYHRQCYINFRGNLGIPSHFVASTDSPCGIKRRNDEKMDLNLRNHAFVSAMAQFQEEDDGEFTINDLCALMAEREVEPYSHKFMKQRIMEHFEGNVTFTKVRPGEVKVCLRSSTADIMREFYRTKLDCTASKTEDQIKSEILTAAACLLRNDMLDILNTNKEAFNFFHVLESQEQSIQFLPPSLRILLEKLFRGKNKTMKIASIGHAIIEASRPRSLSTPLQLGLGIELHHHFSSRYLIDLLHSMGFCSSYKEVTLFENNAAMVNKTDIDCLSSESFVQFVADNADHNLCTLDGKNTFHGMGIIAAVTRPSTITRKIVPRSKEITSKDIRAAGSIRIVPYNQNATFSLTVYSALPNVETPDPAAAADLLWHIAWHLKMPRPGWNGVMQTSLVGRHAGAAKVVFLPFIDLSASNETCIYSTLSFVAQQAEKYRFVPILTFDQPLYWKAKKIIISCRERALSGMIVRLGGFHTLMSFVGSIGHLMDGSGLQDVIELIYAADTVPYILNGKAISRAIRAHQIVDSALHACLMSDVFNSEALSENLVVNEEEQRALRAIFDDFVAKKLSVKDIASSPLMKKLQNIVESKLVLASASRTARLWIMYMDMVALIRKFIRADRTGNWNLHLQASMEMLPFFAAAGHNNYTKSCRLYLQDILALKETHPDIEKSFQDGLFIVRRSDRYWAGEPTDLVIEQVLMRSMKSSDGFTRRSGITQDQRQKWVMSRPICSLLSMLMQDLTGVGYKTSEQHKEMGKSRIVRDHKDIQTVLDYLTSASPFVGDKTVLRSISTGVSACESCNVESAKSVGQKILDSMTGICPDDYTFRQKEQAVLMTAKTKSIGAGIGQVDPSLLFQRLMMIVKRSDLKEAEVFHYELCSHPTSLFDKSGLMRAADKAEFSKVIASISQIDVAVIESSNASSSEFQYVLDGGALLHRLPWSKGDTYFYIAEQYFKYVTKHYGNIVTIVFDGYEECGSTKDMTHLRRNRMIGQEVLFTADMKLTTKKEEFLSSKTNKSRFVKFLSNYLEDKKLTTIQATGDADVLIVQTAVQLSRISKVKLIGDDTDLLVLLLHHVDQQSRQIFLINEGKGGKKGRSWDIHLIQEKLGKNICNHILFAHAILGCDTTSRFHGIGKGVVLKKLTNIQDNILAAASNTFMKKNASKEEVAAAGEKAIVALYGGTNDVSLNVLRYQIFQKKVAVAKIFVHPEDLPPTSAAAKFHSYRAYYQVQCWMGSQTENLSALDWGWFMQDGLLKPVTTDLAAAPQNVLQVVKCGCKTMCRTLKCSCRKNGIECNAACTGCKGLHCTNSKKECEEELSEEE